MRILLSGGGTGGHVYPILAVLAAIPRAEATRRIAAIQQVEPTRDPAGHQPAGQGAERLPGATPRSGDLTGSRPVTKGVAPSSGSQGVEPVEVLYVGEAGGIEQMLAEREGLPFAPVATGQIRGRAVWTAAGNLAKMARGTRETAVLISQWRPDAVFMTGGYVAAPVAWAAYRAKPRVPLMIYLPDLTPGRAIQSTSYLARKVAVSFPEVAHFFGTKAVVTGYPVRADLFTTEKHEAWAALGLQADLPVLLVFGGSRGARSINRALVEALPDLLPICQVLHMTGQNDWEESQRAARAILQQAVQGGRIDTDALVRYHPHAYIHDMVHALVAADLVVARAGAATLGEFPAAKLPAVLAPYPFAGQHQDANARYLADRGAALVVPDSELGERLKPTLLDLLGHPERLQTMAAAAAALARPDAATNIAAELLALASGRHANPR